MAWLQMLSITYELLLNPYGGTTNVIYYVWITTYSVWRDYKCYILRMNYYLIRMVGLQMLSITYELLPNPYGGTTNVIYYVWITT